MIMTKDFEQIHVSTNCPICKRNISEVWRAKLDSVIGLRYAYICCECENLLKISKDKISEFPQNTTSLFNKNLVSENTSV